MIATSLIVLTIFIMFIVPLFFINIIPQSTIGNYFSNNTYYAYAVLPFILYITITGFYFYNIKIDAYIMNFTSYRTISGLFKAKNYIEFPHDMLIGFSFFKRPFSLNKTLMLSFKDNSGKKIVKRFNISFLRKVEKNRINKVLEQIIAKNK